MGHIMRGGWRRVRVFAVPVWESRSPRTDKTLNARLGRGGNCNEICSCPILFNVCVSPALSCLCMCVCALKVGSGARRVAMQSSRLQNWPRAHGERTIRNLSIETSLQEYPACFHREEKGI